MLLARRFTAAVTALLLTASAISVLLFSTAASQAEGQSGVCEEAAGLAVDGRPVFSVQHHPEASPGPKDSLYLFERFAGMMDKAKAAAREYP